MKKNIDNENIVLDEEKQNVEKQKPSAKRIVTAVILILLAVVFVVLGFCLTFGMFDNIYKCNIAFADSTDTVDSLAKQSVSNWSLENINSYSKIYGLFFNSNYKLDYDFCVQNDNLFYSPYEDGADGCYNKLEIRSLPVESDKSTYTLVVTVQFAKLSTNILKQITDNDFSSSVYMVGVTCEEMSSTYTDGSLDFCLGAFANDNDMSLFKSSVLNTVFHLVDSVPVGLIDIGYFGVDWGATYEYFVNYESTFQGESLSLFNDFVYLSMSNMGGSDISEDDYNAVVSENENLQAMIDKYDNMFSYVPIEYKVVNGSLETNIGERVRYDTSKYSNIFITSESVLYSSLIDVNTGVFIGDIEGLKDGFTANGIWGRLYTETDTYYIFAVYCQIAHLTPYTTSTPKGKLWSWDSANNTLTCLSDVIAFPNETVEEEFNGYYDKGFNDGKFTAENDVKTTTDGIISVLESPVNFLKTVFNFEIFGINLSAVIFFVLSVIIVAYVIKKVV